jgi:aspartokinase/homoserine dehydrogenase 1
MSPTEVSLDKVLKFGGSSVSNAERIRNVADILQKLAETGERFAVVVSAMGGGTDRLIRMSQLAAEGSLAYEEDLQAFSDRHREAVDQLVGGARYQTCMQEIIEGQQELGNLLKGLYLTRDLTPRTMDFIQSFGERSLAFILSEVLKARGLDAMYVDTRKLIKTNESYGNAKVYMEDTRANLQQFFRENEGKIAIMTGFIASTRTGISTTLGRGGSDYTASIVGASLNVKEIQIWTDVDGVLTADPRIVKQAFSIPVMTYEEALEMSHFGAKVIYPPTIIPALEKRIPLRIKNSFNPDAPGTLISEQAPANESAVTGVASISHVALLSLEGSGLFGASTIAARLFQTLANQHINAILITQGSSEHSISFAVPPHLAAKAKEAIDEEFELEIKAKLISPIRVEDDLSVIAAIGENMKSRPGISGRFFDALGKNGINVIVTAQGSSERNISVIIRKEDEAKAIAAVHNVFFLSDYYTLNLFVVGVGLIGGTLLKQIQQQAEWLRTTQYVKLNVVALANSKKMVFDPAGIQLDSWAERLAGAEEQMDMAAFVERMKSMNMLNSVFIDNTAETSIVAFYPEILDASISISTPNKAATSGSYFSYRKLKSTADTRGVKFMYETNVGAGLPIITTLTDLINSGDRILKIEGVLSGSLSFIFNTFRAGMSFSEVVAEAGKRGFTEPDPRIDLSGKDVARKILILAREAGYPLEFEDVVVENILPQPCIDAPDPQAFMEELRKHDDAFAKKIGAAAAEGKFLRFVACLDQGKASVSLRAVSPDHPFAQLSGSDNMIVFTTERYRERPLVIKGPGAGAEVTAAGVFAEILRIGYYLS